MVRKLASLRDQDWQYTFWRHPHPFNKEDVEVYRTVISYKETAVKELQDTSCWGSGGAPSFISPPRLRDRGGWLRVF